MDRRVGVALSGGGHRATAWGFGTLLALVDARVNLDTVSIASVSGGSITNGVVAQAIEFADADTPRFEEVIRPALRHIASEGLFVFGPATDGYLARVLMLAGAAVAAVVALIAAAITVGREATPWWWLLTGPVLTLGVWLLWLRKAAMPGRWLLLIAASGLVLPSLFCLGAVALVEGTEGWQAAWRLLVVLVVTLGFFAAAISEVERRSEVIDDALADVHFHREGGATTKLVELKDRKTHHVFCATELQSGDHVYFTPRLVYSYRVGQGEPVGLRLSTAVQASACLPGAFAAREIPTGSLGLKRPWPVPDDRPARPPDVVVVNDGGVYDNMADQWEQGLGERMERLGHGIQEPATHLIVANAGRALGWRAMKRTGPLSREVRALGRTVDILYDVTTSHRRQGLIRRFRATEAIGSGLEGALVHIAQSPYDVPQAFADGDDLRAKRASEALALLSTLGVSVEEWDARADANAQVPTVLRALGAVTVDLLEHAYLLASVNLYVLFGWGDLRESARFDRKRFAALCDLSSSRL